MSLLYLCLDKKEENLPDVADRDRSESRTSSRSSGRTSKVKGRNRGGKRRNKMKEDMAPIQEQTPAVTKSAKYVFKVHVIDKSKVHENYSEVLVNESEVRNLPKTNDIKDDK